MNIRQYIKKLLKKNKREFDHICRVNGLRLDYALNADELLVLKEIFVERAYADYFPFYETATVVDVGAHVGYFSLFAAKNLASDSKIIAIEPSSRNVEKLGQNIAANKVENIQAVHAALSDKTGAQTLHLSRSENNSLYADTAATESETVVTLTLKQLFKQCELETIDFLKLDCEGAEYAILYKAAPETLKCIQTISMEFHDMKKAECTGLQLANFLADQGFKIVKLEHGRTNFGSNYGKLVATRF